MRFFDKILDEVREETREGSFSDMIRECRDRIGIKQYRMAEFVGISLNRLRNLESAYYRAMPKDEEIKAFADILELDFELLRQRAEEHVEKRQRDRKVRIIEDGSSAVPHMQAAER